MFQISDQRVEISINKLKDEALTTLLCGGIVNPFGPTLTAMALLGEAERGRTVDLVEIMLNPFAHEAHRIGRATISETWTPMEDCASLLEICCLRGCPTLLLPSRLFDISESVEIHASWLCRFPDAERRWKMIQKHRFDPWTRIDEEIKAGFGTLTREAETKTESRLSGSDAIEFAKFALSDEHTVPELQAFMFAWKGSIDFQSESGSGKLAAEALQLDSFADWLSLIAYTCRFPANPNNG